MRTSWNVVREIAFRDHHLTFMLCELSKHLHENVLFEPHSIFMVKMQLLPFEVKKPDRGLLPKGGREGRHLWSPGHFPPLLPVRTWEKVAGLQLLSEGSPGASFLPVLPPVGLPGGLPGGDAPGLYMRKHAGEARFVQVT